LKCYLTRKILLSSADVVKAICSTSPSLFVGFALLGHDALVTSGYFWHNTYRMKRGIGFTILLTAFLVISVNGQTKGEKFFPLDQVRPGLQGVGKTVFEGNTVEEFGVEILGVLAGRPGPKQTTIIVRLKGPRVEHTKIFAGMSGSPVYINGQLLGAIAYAFAFATEPIAGITPIQDMLGLLELKEAEKPQPDSNRRRTTASDQSAPQRNQRQLLAERTLPQLSDLKLEATPIDIDPRVSPSLSPLFGQQLIPIATPLSVSGISAEAIERFLPELKKVGLLPVATLSGGAAITPLTPYNVTTLTPGKVVSAELVRGDFSLEALGTVTYRDGESVYAFGHRLFNLGGTEIPMSEATSITVVPNLLNSFRLGVTGTMVGTLKQDRSTGIAGKLGVQPVMIPLLINHKTSRGVSQTYRCELINNNVLAPLLVNLTLFSAITAQERSFGDVTLRVKGQIKVRGQEAVVLDNRFSAVNDAPVQASLSVALPVSYLLGSGLDDVRIDGITLDIEASENRRTGALDRVWVNRTDVRRGETVELHVFARGDDGKEVVERVPVQIPEDAPIGKLSLVVGDGAAVQAYDGRPGLAALGSVQNVTQLIRALNRLRKSDRLYLKIVRSSSGAVVNNEELPSLPPSVLATIGSDRTAGGYQPVQYATLKEIEIPPADFIITGQRQVTVNVVR
jgi:hypothetical protein